MNCNVISDLLPLYIDACCSEQTKELVESHVSSCPRCKEMLEEMRQEIGTTIVSQMEKKQNPVQLWRASVLQVVLFFLSFVVMAWGVSWEARIPSGFTNGMFAFNLVIPVTAFMLSLANWFFVQQYRSRKQFCRWSGIFHIVVYLVTLLWGLYHYGYFEALFDFEALSFYLYMLGLGMAATVLLNIAMWALSNVYAKLLGKE